MVGYGYHYSGDHVLVKSNVYAYPVCLYFSPLKDILKVLHPLFELDFYLPRTILACLKPFELREVIGDEIIPVEICCASIFFHIKNTSRGAGHGTKATSEVKGEEKVKHVR